MTDTNLDDANWTPARTSTAVAVVGTAAGVAALSSAVGVRTGAVAAVGGAVCLAAAFRLLALDRWQVPARLAAGFLLVPAGAGVTVGVGYELLVAFAASFPANTPAEVVGRSLRIVSVLAVLWGCTLAAFGAATSVRGDATARTLGRSRSLAIRVAFLPVASFLVLAGRALVTNFDLGAVGIAGEFVGKASDWLFAPTPGQFHLLGLWLLLAAASYAVHHVVRVLPLRALAGEATLGEVRVADLVVTLRQWTGRVLALVALALPLALLLGIDAFAEVVREATSPALYRSFNQGTVATGVRRLLAGVALGAGALSGVTALVRRSSRTATRDLLTRYAPFVTGATVVAGVGVVHRPVLRGLLDFVAGRLDPPLDGRFRDLSSGVVEFYGSETLVLGLTAGVLAFAAFGLLGLSVWFALGFVEDSAAGPALAGTGLFVAAGFAGTVGVSLWAVLGGLVVALAVWDAGEFAATLGSEVGRRGERRRVELLHSLAAVGVGGLAAVAAAGLVGVTSTEGVGPASGGELGGLALALLGAVAAVVLLVLALR